MTEREIERDLEQLFHEAANAFPLMDEKRLQELAEDIKVNGLRVPITLCDGKVLDGRNRLRACVRIGRMPLFEGPDALPFKRYEGDPWSYVWSLNGQRRDLVAEQRYLIWRHCTNSSDVWNAARLVAKIKADEKRSEAQKGIPKAEAKERAETECCRTSKHPGAKSAAAASKTNPGAVARGDKLAKERPDLAEKVRLGAIKPAEAHRQAKRDAVSKKVQELPKDKHVVIYADPPWSYSDKQSVKGEFGTGTGAAEGHYPSMSLSELKAMAIPDIAAVDSVLFLWVTSPLLPDGMELASAWGFKYKACFIWDKVKHNMGHYNSVRHEFLLVCTRGSCVPQVSKLFDSVQSIERSAKHSEKPEEFRQIIDTIYPNGKRIELFARTQVSGWDRWGAEA